MNEQKTTKRSRKVNKPIHAVDFTVWAVNGGPLPEETVARLEEGFEQMIFELFNEGQRLLTQTNYG